MPKELILTFVEGGCLVPTSHKLNKDGYFRKNIGKGQWVMYHRFMWEKVHGPIPEGFEVNHRCKNRACCNVNHLELLEGSDHATETNLNRYVEIKNRGYTLWLAGTSAKSIAKSVNRDPATVYRWIKQWSR